MQGKRKPKKLTAKQCLERNEQLERENMMLKIDIRERTINFLTQMQVFEGIMRATLESAGTIGEAKRWYDEWVHDVNQIDIEAIDHNEQMQALIERHGFEIDIKDHGEMVDQAWSKKEVA